MLKKASWIVVLAIAVPAACKEVDGECYRRGEGPGAGVGGSVIVPGGPGGFGDVPPEPQDADDPPPECNVSDETELGAVTCGRPSWGTEACQALCAANGVLCIDQLEFKSYLPGKMLSLYKCCGCKGKQECWYVNPDKTSQVCVHYVSEGRVKCQVN